MYYIILEVFLLGITYAGNCTISADKCPRGEINWKRRAADFTCTNINGKYTCIKDLENRLVETCVDNILIKEGVVGCPFILICKDNTALIGLDEDFSECPTNHSGCPPQHHTGYALHEIYKYPACSGNSESLVSENEDSSTNQSDKITWTPVVVPIVSILAILFVVLGILLHLKRKSRLDQCCTHATKSNDAELGTSQRLMGDQDERTGGKKDKELWDEKIQAKMQKFGEEMAEAIKRRDSEKVIEKVDEWKKECVHIGIAGRSMAGKSSFINAMLGKTTKQKAKIGQGNTTIEPTLYFNPKYEGLKFWDYPGYGTPEFPLNNEYLTAQHFEHCNLVLVLYSSVLEETDITFINHLVSLKHTFALVKTNADNLKNKNMKHEPFDKLVRTAKEKCQTTLKKQCEYEDVRIFVISNITPSLGDFDNLIDFLTKSIDETKRMHVLMTLHRQTTELIDEKEKQLLDRAWKAAIAIGVSVALPLPGIDIAFNMAVLMREITSYLDVFHLDKESLKLHPKHHVKKLKTCQYVLKSGFIKDNLKKFAVTSATAAAFEIAVPVFGGIANGLYSVSCMYNFLKNVIADLANDAKTLMKLQNESFV